MLEILDDKIRILFSSAKVNMWLHLQCSKNISSNPYDLVIALINDEITGQR